MCAKCIELDGKIEHYEHIAALIYDESTTKQINKLVWEMKVLKLSFHPQGMQ